MKQIKLFKSILVSTMTLSLIGCHVQNSTLISPVKDPVATNKPGGRLTEEKFSPKADILFIIDNSLSMERHQENLKQNVNLFVDELVKDQLVDIQIAVTPIFDSVRYGPIVPRICEETKEVLFQDNGTLVKPKAPQGKEDLLKSQPVNFIKRSEGFVDVLKETLKIGVDAPKPGDKCTVRGPAFEEYFTTIKAAFELAKNGGPNSSFYRGPDSHLVVFILSDTGDGSAMSAAEVYNYLRELRGDPEGKTFTIHAVTDPGHQCASSIGAEIDDSGPIEKTQALVSLAKGQIISMCDPQYGKKLANLGTELRKKVMENLTIRLQEGIPEEYGLPNGKTLRLTLGGEELPDTSWVYNTSTKTITLLPGVPWSKYPGQSVQVKYVPVDMTRKNVVKLTK